MNLDLDRCRSLGPMILWRKSRNHIFFRPLEVDTLLGNPRIAKKELNWRPKISLKKMISEMIKSEISST